MLLHQIAHLSKTGTTLTALRIWAQKGRKQTTPERARGESSVSSLGVTSLFLGEEGDMNYEGDDEACFQTKPPPQERKHSRDSAIDMDCLPSEINTEEDQVNIDVFYRPHKERDSGEQDDSDRYLMKGSRSLPA